MRFDRSLAFALFAMAAGCEATASISSVRDPSASAHFVRLYMAVDRGSIEPEYAASLFAALTAELKSRGANVAGRILTGLDLDLAVVNGEVNAWRPDGILVADFAGGTGADVAYNVSLIEVASNRRIWRAVVRSHKGFGTSTGMMEETAASVGERLEQDHLIGRLR